LAHPSAQRPSCAIECADLLSGGLKDVRNRTVDCAEVHVFFRKRWSISDGFRLEKPLRELTRLGNKTLVLHAVPGGRIAEEFLSTHLPDARIVR